MDTLLDVRIILSLIDAYGYPILYVISTIEGPTITAFSGFLVAASLMSLVPTFLVLFAGDLTGDTLYYSAGRFGGRRLLARFGHRVTLTEERIEYYASRFRIHDWLLLIVAKTQPLGTAIHFSAGMAKHSYLRFIFINAVISVPKTLVLMGIGYFLGETILNAEEFSRVSLISAALVLVCIATYVLTKRFVQSKSRDI